MMIFSEIALRPDADINALRLLARQDRAHALMWRLHGDPAQKGRNFVYMPRKPGQWYSIAETAPIDDDGIVSILSKPFIPTVKEGDILLFSACLNPVISCRDEAGKRVKRDVVMHQLHPIPKAARASKRAEIVPIAVFDWLNRSEAFELNEQHFNATNYHQIDIERPGKTKLRMSSVDVSGALKVRDADAMQSILTNGFGRGKAFGFGLFMAQKCR